MLQLKYQKKYHIKARYRFYVIFIILSLYLQDKIYKTTVIVRPLPFLFSAEILPLCACTIAFATERPIPDPPVPEFLELSSL